GAVSASTTYVPGVKVGDWWNYGNFKFVGPAINITGIILVVTAVSGSNVTLKGTFVSGGNIQTQIFRGDLNSGIGNLTQFPPLVAANLGPGDHLVNSPSAPTFNNTITATYAGATRQINVVNITGTPFSGPSQVLFYQPQPPGSSSLQPTAPRTRFVLGCMACSRCNQIKAWVGAFLFGLAPVL